LSHDPGTSLSFEYPLFTSAKAGVPNSSSIIIRERGNNPLRPVLFLLEFFYFLSVFQFFFAANILRTIQPQRLPVLLIPALLGLMMLLRKTPFL